MEDITDEYCNYAKVVWKGFKLKSLGEYHDSYLCHTFVLADERFYNKRIEIYELAPAHFLSVPTLTWQAFFKKTGVEL